MNVLTELSRMSEARQIETTFARFSLLAHLDSLAATEETPIKLVRRI